jgi:phosphohistidine phosphatase
MKTLLLMRHGKSSWKETKVKDHERPLNKRGQKSVPRMGELIKEAELVPQVILSSSAVRARQTAELLAPACGFTGEVQYFDSLYMAEPEAVIKRLRKLPDDVERVLVIGHNPGLEALVQMLSRRIESLPTASIAYFSLPIDTWKDFKKDIEAETMDIWRPKELDTDQE